MAKERVAVFIDGSNFYFKLKSLGLKNTSRFDFRKFAEWLARDRAIVFCGYYVGVVRAQPDDARAQTMREAQRNLFNRLISPEQRFVVKKGYLMNNDGVFHEKGVDVQIAVDMLAGAYENQYDAALLVSSDTDLVPAIVKMKERGKAVECIGFSHQPSFALLKYATITRLLIKNDVEQFIPKILV
ncbi:MAG: hypothetical protein A3C90_03475 [Candidatus Magasanikbacteria bacterium RIFCSPHIGHO2_02_FULL_51_14]|uniref:NYN domain-containing protein n=1 Tax=Candidatus Magasanikbacteria bacterium RIFCSPHIGHO2_02_FULL_51_14 TaxID=1798683 RepID=A0A1F6MR91_9BACT|nr:MAG: hypothetical protein A3C90_03475 [Candidatus Magasanikbacteria bacterium RIFCSPHIGHO2_02_FULL_51_14]